MARDKYALIMRILDDQNRLTDRADTKAISLLTALGLFTVLFISQLNAITVVVPFTIFLLVIYCVSVILSVLHIIMAISPRLRTAKKTGVPQAGEEARAASTPQPTFFGGICQFPDAIAYGKTLDELSQSDENIHNTYTSQIYEVAQINRTKYKFVGRAVWFVVATLISQIALIIFLFSQRISNLIK